MAYEQQRLSFYGLVRLLSVDDNFFNSDDILQESAARAVADLAEVPESRNLIAAAGGVVEGTYSPACSTAFRN